MSQQHSLMPEDLEVTGPVQCYNGCFDSATQQVLDRQEEAMAWVRKHEPDAHVTYFATEEQYLVHVYGRPLSAYAKTRGAAIHDACQRLSYLTQ